MVAFEVFKNGKLKVRAGSGELGFLGAFLHWIKKDHQATDDFKLVEMGSDYQADKNLDWINEDLVVGDEITIKINYSTKPDVPIKITSRTVEDFVMQSKLKRYHTLKKELENKGLI
jgi:hypothetical protein